MESNFTMEVYKQDNDLHINIKGSFDGASAFALLNEISNGSYQKNKSIYVETEDISTVSPFGRIILASNIPKMCRKSVCFSGAMAERIAPEGCVIDSSRRNHRHDRTHAHHCACHENCLCRKKEVANPGPKAYR